MSVTQSLKTFVIEQRRLRSPAKSLPMGRHGVAAVEFAIILPVVLTLLLGCVDYGRALHWSIAVSNAAASGSYYAASHRVSPLTYQAWEEAIRSVVIDELDGHPRFFPDNLSIDVSTEDEIDGNLLVTVSTTYQFQTIVSWPVIPTSLPLKSTVTFRQFK